MVVDFLKKYQEELISQKIEIKEDLDLVESKIKEETKFLSILEDNNETYFSVFTPRNVNEKNNNRANEIKQNLISLNNTQQELATKMKIFDSRLQEVTTLINESNNSKRMFDDNSVSDTYSNFNCNEIISQLTAIKGYLFQDPQRAIIEIDSIINSLS